MVWEGSLHHSLASGPSTGLSLCCTLPDRTEYEAAIANRVTTNPPRRRWGSHDGGLREPDMDYGYHLSRRQNAAAFGPHRAEVFGNCGLRFRLRAPAAGDCRFHWGRDAVPALRPACACPWNSPGRTAWEIWSSSLPQSCSSSARSATSASASA